MPELPEVERIRQSLSPGVLGKRVVGATLHRRDVLVVPGDPAGGFSRQRSGASKPRRYEARRLLVGTTVVDVKRLGKELAIVGETGGEGVAGRSVLLVRLGMTGQLVLLGSGARASKRDHIHATLRLEGGGRLLFRDPRRFGGLRAFENLESLSEHWSGLGPDALGVTGPVLRERLGGSARAIKAALLDQRVIAGVGNIYADEALFESGIAPGRAAGSLSEGEASALASAIRAILARAIEAGGSSIRDYLDAGGVAGTAQRLHRVYGRGGLACERCGGELAQILLAQRTTVFCPACQR
ncbi:MAG: bifunctional DNA-formamidopyrimidine glycosylase/DNA-(apurinic or apyrimidinic site) lyase [Phycisphaerales bacterium]|nr:MAG: bifunctional DNA-formamidopyrimidine glycosylase/DNA-(apurinic or apyrimidinic site) lyase [Phycisphaerales bacterium]